MTDALARNEGSLILAAAEAISDWAEGLGVRQVITPYAPVGPAADGLRALDPVLSARNITLVRALRPYDADLWPHATRGFFPFREAAMG